MSIPLCRSLRWRGAVGTTWREDAALAASLASGGTPFTCSRTCQPWGPDDDLVEPGACAPGRACYRRSPKAPGPPSLG